MVRRHPQDDAEEGSFTLSHSSSRAERTKSSSTKYVIVPRRIISSHGVSVENITDQSSAEACRRGARVFEGVFLALCSGLEKSAEKFGEVLDR